VNRSCTPAAQRAWASDQRGGNVAPVARTSSRTSEEAKRPQKDLFDSTKRKCRKKEKENK
jgi:hypothetical protein